ncbi:hypothetical protein M8C21_024854 [Ambrosia artemisiifolia]|uniref:Uncharacterized protein n=1 Tax=Ambrosia artemisiifolia TaxID=4212 RepID=A0AAD5DBS4_AMBAR|nr:hypothetical protein M8C21_024854 [Ambrosia artemisiifolia]
MALGVAGLGCEDALIHLLNYVWPNIFETSPHVINAVMEAIEGMRVALGAWISYENLISFGSLLVNEKSLTDNTILFPSASKGQVNTSLNNTNVYLTWSRLMKKKDVAKVIFEVKKDLHQHDELHSEHSLKIPHGRYETEIECSTVCILELNFTKFILTSMLLDF